MMMRVWQKSPYVCDAGSGSILIRWVKNLEWDGVRRVTLINREILIMSLTFD
jgi:hypothetical protein